MKLDDAPPQALKTNFMADVTGGRGEACHRVMDVSSSDHVRWVLRGQRDASFDSYPLGIQRDSGYPQRRTPMEP